MEQIYNDNRYVKKWANVKRAMDLLGGKCQSCGETHVATLSFHHSDPEQKEHLVSHLVKGRDWDLIEAEVKKCTLLCENCHRKTHFDDKRYSRLFQAICDKSSGKKTSKEINMKRWSEDHKKELIVLYNQGKSTREISLILDRNDDVIRKKINDFLVGGVLQKREKPPRSKQTKVTPELKEQVFQLSSKFVSAFEISKTTGISLGRVHKILKEKKNDKQELVFDSTQQDKECTCC